MHKAARSASSDFWGQEVSSRLEEAYPLQGRTPFDEAVSDSLSEAVLETASWRPPISTQGS